MVVDEIKSNPIQQTLKLVGGNCGNRGIPTWASPNDAWKPRYRIQHSVL